MSAEEILILVLFFSLVASLTMQRPRAVQPTHVHVRERESGVNQWSSTITVPTSVVLHCSSCKEETQHHPKVDMAAHTIDFRCSVCTGKEDK